MITAQDFVSQMLGGAIPARVLKPRKAKAPEVSATCTPEVAAFIDPAGTLQDAGLVMVKAWQPLPGFGPFVPTLANMYAQERAGLTVKATNALVTARRRLYELRATFPDAIEDPVKLARFTRARRLTGPKLAAMLPGWAKAWAKAHSLPAPFVFIPNQPARFPAWTYR